MPSDDLKPNFRLRTLILFGTLVVICFLAIEMYGKHYLSPFIQYPPDLFGRSEEWARACFPKGITSQYWIFSSLQAIVLLIFHFYAYRWLTDQSRKKFNFNSRYLNFFAYPFFVLAFALKMWLNILILNGAFSYTYLPKVYWAFLGLSWAILGFLGIRLFLVRYGHSMYRNVVYLLKASVFLYPSLLYILALTILFTSLSSFNQFQALFIELTQWPNFFLFSLVFLISILMVWFVPYYLLFTGLLLRYSLYAEGKEDKYPGAGQLLSRKILYLPVKWVAEEVYNKIKTDYREDKVDKRTLYDADGRLIEDKIFNITRRGMGFAFIILLLFLIAGAGWDSFIKTPPSVVLIITLITLFIFYRLMRRHLPMPKKKSSTEYLREIKSINIWLFLLIPTGLFIALNIVTQILSICLPKVSNWPIQHILFIATTFTSVFAFAALSNGRRFLRAVKMDLRAKPFLKRLKGQEDGLTFLLINAGVFLPTLVGWVFFFYVVFFNMNGLAWLNPITLFLVAVNGMVGTIAIMDRAINMIVHRNTSNLAVPALTKASVLPQSSTAQTASDQQGKRKAKIRYRKYAYISIIACLFLFWLATRQQDNGYHDVPFLAVEDRDTVPPPLTDLSAFTKSFLDRIEGDSTQPIYLIAAEGGGLRAAYWTMLVLQKLDEQHQNRFFDRVFLMTGISGGMIGQGMYTHLKSQDLDAEKIKQKIQELGAFNYLSGDLSGIFGRGILSTVWRLSNLSNWENRAEAMSRQYFTISGGSKTTYSCIRDRPYHKLWTESDNTNLPLLIINTTRSEDGRRGIVHPLGKQFREDKGFIDLSRNFKDELISFPDALFLTNRFPIASPAASIEGHGHFVDGGYLENSGLQTLLHVLSQMYSHKDDSTSVFSEFFKRNIVVISVSNSASTFIEQTYGDWEDIANRNLSSAELPQIISAVANGGLTALPNYYNRFFTISDRQNMFGDTLKFLPITMPYQVENQQVHTILQGQIPSCSIDDSLKQNQLAIKKATQSTDLPQHKWYSRTRNYFSPAEGKDTFYEFLPLPSPPLGRVIAEPTLQYMDAMLLHPYVIQAFSEIDP